MTGPLERAAAFFVAPAKGAPAARAVSLPPAARTVVLGGSDEVAALAAAIALDGPTAGLVALWRGEHAPGGLSTRAAARLAARLAAHDLPAYARGRLAWLTLPDDPYLAAVAVRCASALVPGPFVTALAGPRPAELETLVAEHDVAVVVAAPGTALARAAVAALRSRGVDATAIAPPRRGALRSLALAGLAAPRLESSRAREVP